MRIWVVGANGFTGRRVLSCLSGTGKYEVMGCSLRPDILPGSGDYSFVQMDINNYVYPGCRDKYIRFVHSGLLRDAS